MRKEPDFYAELGYEDCGYMPPPLSTKDTYPDYIHEEVMDSVRKIRENQGKDTVTFAFMTDLHYYANNENHEIRMKRTLNAYKEIAKRAPVDRLILGGDYTNEGCKTYKSECFRELRGFFEGLTYYPVHGNHDDGSIWDKSYLRAEKSVNHLTHEELYGLFYDHLPDAGVCLGKENPSLYYYFNDSEHKVRYICLDSGDIPYVLDGNGKLLYDGQHHFAMSQRQIEWLVNEALFFEEEGWGVMFFQHSLALPDKKPEELGEIRKHMSVLNDIAECYHNGEDINQDYYDGHFKLHVKADFSQCIRGEIIAFFVGDYHVDKVTRNRSGIPYILTANCVMYCGSPSSVGRKDGEISELLFDIVTVDRKRRKIYMTRVGAGNDREIEY